jgi:hypothetical protein
MLCIAGTVVAGAAERRSEQRGNRLYRDGAFPDAARLYGGRVLADSTPARLHYNFGTALIGLGSPSATLELERAASTADLELRAHALYNLGRWHLVRARDANASDSVRVYADLSIDANKSALRLEPGRPDARWNLALAQRMLDSINAESGRAGTEAVDGSADSDQRVMSDDLREFEDDTEVSDAPRQGTDEALAQGEEVAPLSAIEAEEILTADGDRSVIVRKLLTYEGRVRRPGRVGLAGPRW